MSSQNNLLDLNEVKSKVFENLDLLLDSLGLEYSIKGDVYSMCCPIHAGSDNENGMTISVSKRQWRCWTRDCDQEYKRDIFGFVRGVLSAREGDEKSFSYALRYICNVYSISRSNTSAAKPKEEKTEDGFSKIVKMFNKEEEDKEITYERNFETANNSFYYEKRGFKRETLDFFGVKDCIDRDAKVYRRAVIPVIENGKEIAYIARATKDFVKPKYIFSEGFVKTKHFYNYDNAIEKAIEKNCLIIFEGQGDVWRMYEAGVTNCVGMFGKTISRRQQSILESSGITTLVIMADNDQPGREAKVEISRQLSRMFKIIFPSSTKKDVGDMTINQINKQVLPQIEGLY